MRRKINKPFPLLNSPEIKAVVDRLHRKEPELSELVHHARKSKKRKSKTDTTKEVA